MCNCINDINAKLVEMGKNTQLDIPVMWTYSKDKQSSNLSADRVGIKTKKLDEKKREKPISVMPSYCPFCGKKYPEVGGA